MTYLAIEELETVVIDFTSYCNAMCGNCSRNIKGKDINPNMPLSHMSLETWKKIFDCDSLDLKEVIFNGSYGDPIFNPNLIKALEHLLTLKNKPIISIHTNGGLGTLSLYKDLALILKKFPYPSHITFSIDGLEDTNHLYRRNVSWKKVMSNCQEFIQNGGMARWRMLVFKHNEHQIDQCKSLSEELGFKKFDINGGHSFSALDSVIKGKAIEFFKKNKKENERVVEYSYLDHKERVENLINKHETLDSAWKNCNITCKWQSKKKIQISHTGIVLPCCYFLSDLYSKTPESVFANDVRSILNDFEKNWNDINYHNLEEILNHRWFKEHLPNSWSNDRYEMCSRSCGH
jgi:hypothetical protein